MVHIQIAGCLKGGGLLIKEVQVQAYSGYKVNERPLAFILDGERHEISDILDRWYEGGLSPKSQKLDYFKVRTTQKGEYILRYNYQFDCWSIMLPEPVTPLSRL